MSFAVGDRTGDYQVVRILGAGGMGKVYQVRNLLSDRVEAMKVLLPNLQDDPDLADRFLREIKVQASLSHPNIAGLHTAQRVGNQLLMFMEFIEGESLEARIERGPLPIAEAVSVFCQVLDALQYAHARGVVHRDIKPPNIMITPEGRVKLMDFGIARLKDDRQLTQTGRTLGSLYYMAPEQIRAEKSLDGRVDLYSLGITLYETVTGQRPFQGDSDYSLMAAHLSQNPRPPIEIQPGLPPMLNEVILMAIAKDPAQRFQSAEAFRNALGNVATPAAERTRVVTPAPAPALPPSASLPRVVEAVPPAPPRSHRGLYMAMGSLATVAVLAFAAYQIPRLARTSAASGEPMPQTAVPAEQPKPDPVPSPVQNEPPQTTPVTPPSRPVSRPVTAQPEPQTQPPASVPQPVTQPAAPQTSPPAQPGYSQPADTPPAAQPPQPAVDTAELEKLRDRMMQLAARISAVQAKARRIEAEQKAQGLGMRSDVVTGLTQMNYFMDQTEKALDTGNAPAARTALQRADRVTEMIERILGI